MNNPILRRNVAGLITIDVEPDNVWENAHSNTFDNILQLPRFHEICKRFGIKPTYLVSWSVANNSNCAKILESLLSYGDCEIGIHPHLWETPPFIGKDKHKICWVGPQYDYEILENKIEVITNTIKERFGAPKSHRAGRWGMDSRQISMLYSRGIIVDSSVVPGINYKSTGISDYTNAQLVPYYMSSNDFLQSGSSGLLQVPCTVKSGVKIFGFERNRYFSSVLSRCGLGSEWLRAHPTMKPAALIKNCVWAKENLPCINIMSHSSEFAAGSSPYWPSEENVCNHLNIYERVFDWWRSHDVEPLTLSEFASRLK